MAEYFVRVRVTGYEEYNVTADSPEEAEENWWKGNLIQSESTLDWIESVEELED